MARSLVEIKHSGAAAFFWGDSDCGVYEVYVCPPEVPSFSCSHSGFFEHLKESCCLLSASGDELVDFLFCWNER
jgi:hypothetical protein